jgi:hypothetical protein
MIKKFFISLKISLRGGIDMQYLKIAMKYLGKVLETLSLLDPIVRGWHAIWKPKKKSP